MMRRPASLAAALLLSVAAGSAQSASPKPGRAVGQVHLLRRGPVDQPQPVLRHLPRARGRLDRPGQLRSTPAVRSTKVRSRGRFAEPQASEFGLRHPESRPAPRQGRRHLRRRQLLGRPRHRTRRWAARRPIRPGGPFLNPAGARPRPPAVRRDGTGLRRELRHAVQAGLGRGRMRPAQTPRRASTRSPARSRPSRPRRKSNAFSSRYDESLRGRATLTREEQQGRTLFMGKGRVPPVPSPRLARRPLFTDYSFDNLGLPRNPDNPFYDADPEDNPLGLRLGRPGPRAASSRRAPSYQRAAPRRTVGKHKVPTLRNVAKGSCEADPANPRCIVKAYGHNGYFKSLKAIVHFYNTRDAKPRCAERLDSRRRSRWSRNCWPAPEVVANVNTAELGDLGLTPAEEAAIVAFLKTLSDASAPQRQEQARGRPEQRWTQRHVPGRGNGADGRGKVSRRGSCTSSFSSAGPRCWRSRSSEPASSAPSTGSACSCGRP
ncbi:MAG: hypothetical protein MZW92_78795 [Comamonadaceae bacterium]|nr:hypothetical protein [Comamonadaceae bacterium]